LADDAVAGDVRDAPAAIFRPLARFSGRDFDYDASQAHRASGQRGIKRPISAVECRPQRIEDRIWIEVEEETCL